MSTICALLLFEGCDVMDVVGPYEVLLTANRLAERHGSGPVFDVRTVTVDGQPVVGYGGLGLRPSHGAIAEQDALDVLVVPGVIDLDAALADRSLLAAVRTAGDRAAVAVSVCTGAFLLDEAGVTAGTDVTTHWEDVPVLRRRRRESGHGGRVHAGVRWVDAGSTVTTGGIAAGIDGALHLVERLAGRQLAMATSRQIDHRWREESPPAT